MSFVAFGLEVLLKPGVLLLKAVTPLLRLCAILARLLGLRLLALLLAEPVGCGFVARCWRAAARVADGVSSGCTAGVTSRSVSGIHVLRHSKADFQLSCFDSSQSPCYAALCHAIRKDEIGFSERNPTTPR